MEGIWCGGIQRRTPLKSSQPSVARRRPLPTATRSEVSHGIYPRGTHPREATPFQLNPCDFVLHNPYDFGRSTRSWKQSPMVSPKKIFLERATMEVSTESPLTTGSSSWLSRRRRWWKKTAMLAAAAAMAATTSQSATTQSTTKSKSSPESATWVLSISSDRALMPANGSLSSSNSWRKGRSTSTCMAIGARWSWRVRFVLQIAKAIEALHLSKPPVIHKDIKSSNVLIDENWNARLGDFGLALRGHIEDIRIRSTSPAGTTGYLDPGYITLENLNTKSDVFSFEILLLEMLSGRNACELQPAFYSRL